MTSHSLAIAKAALTAALLRPDPSSVPRDDIAQFHTLLDEATTRCSSENIQTCRKWLTTFVTPSAARNTAFGKFLVARMASIELGSGGITGDDNLLLPKDTRSERAALRSRLYILYLLNDLFHDAKYHGDSAASLVTLTDSLQPQLSKLLQLAAAFDRGRYTKHRKRILELLDIWVDNGYLSGELLKRLQSIVETATSTSIIEGAGASGVASVEGAKQMFPKKDTPFVMPATHGDPSTPYYDLPAGNMLPHIIPNSSIPISAKAMKPLQFATGPADQALIVAVQDFLKDADRIYGESQQDEGIALEVDDLGQTLVRDEVTGDLEPRENYYGWSMTFCESMKKRKRGEGVDSTRGRSKSSTRSVSRSPSASRSRSRSTGWRLAQRRSASLDRRPRGEGSQPRSRDASRQGRNSKPSRDRSRSGARSDSRRARLPRRRTSSSPRSHSRPRYRSRSRSRSHSRSRNRTSRHPPSWSDPNPYHRPPFSGPLQNNPPPPRLGPLSGMPPGPPPPNWPSGPRGVPVPPPPPPNYTGTWPPPPPPPQQFPAPFPPQPGFMPTHQNGSTRHFAPPPPPPNVTGSSVFNTGPDLWNQQNMQHQHQQPPQRQHQHQEGGHPHAYGWGWSA